MPEKTKTYKHLIFTPDVIREADRIFRTVIGKQKSKPDNYIFSVKVSGEESWSHNNEEEFFADYARGFYSARFWKHYSGKGEINFSIHGIDTSVTITLSERQDIEKIFNYLETNVDKCRLPKQPSKKSNAETDWVTETVSKIETHCPVAARKVKIALLKLDSEDTEEWQNATMLIRDAWIELTQWLCQVHNMDTSDVPLDSVIDRLRRLKIDKTDERLFNLARASFNLYGKHHKRDIDIDTAVACVISTVVSMKTVIREATHATG